VFREKLGVEELRFFSENFVQSAEIAKIGSLRPTASRAN
jgi:hypothetical protein